MSNVHGEALKRCSGNSNLVRINYSSKKIPNFLSISILLIFITSCSSSIRFGNDYTYSGFNFSNETRILLYDNAKELLIGNENYLFVDDVKKVLIKPKNKIKLSAKGEYLTITLGYREYTGREFYLKSVNTSFISLNGKKYRGIIKVLNIDGNIKIVNHLSLEDYLKGVITKEMPLGKGKENFEALKAFAIAARTYAYNKIFKRNLYYDLFQDIRDQVYGGVDAETILSDKAVEETKGKILSFEGKPAIVFYHSTCGGYTEDVENVFDMGAIPYLKSIRDGNEPFCNISPNFSWKETFTDKEIIGRLRSSKLIDNSSYELDKINIKSRFNSGRINELEITLKNSEGFKTISIFGNRIRYVLKNKSGTGLLKSNNFTVKFINNTIELSGKGYGHGVGLCQWGAIAQSRLNKNYTEILNHYFPGTEIMVLDD